MQRDGPAAAQSAAIVSGRLPFVAARGQSLTFSGSGFASGMTLALATSPNASTSIAVTDGVTATAKVPDQAPTGFVTLQLAQGLTSQQVSILVSDGKTDYPVYTGDASALCSDAKYYDQNGVLRQGERNCTATPLCTETSTGACIVDGTTYKAVEPKIVDSTKVRVGATVAGVAGTLADCSIDGAIGCVTTAAFPAAAVQNLHAFDIRAGVVVGGQTGQLQLNCRNLVRSASYNEDGLPDNNASSTGTVLDNWDTVDTLTAANSGPSFPTTTPWGPANVCAGTAFINATTSLALQPVPAATVGSDQAWSGILYDQFTGLYVTNTLSSGVQWSAAVALCDNLNNAHEGGVAAGDQWRLPTEIELQQFYINGLYALNTSFFGGYFTVNRYWSATSYGNAAYYVGLGRGTTVSDAKTASYQVMCVR